MDLIVGRGDYMLIKRAQIGLRLVLLIFQSGLDKKEWSSVVVMVLNRSPLRLY